MPWGAPNSLIRFYLQPCINSMSGGWKWSYGSHYLVIPDSGCPKGGHFLSRYSNNSPETCNLTFNSVGDIFNRSIYVHICIVDIHINMYISLPLFVSFLFYFHTSDNFGRFRHVMSVDLYWSLEIIFLVWRGTAYLCSVLSPLTFFEKKMMLEISIWYNS